MDIIIILLLSILIIISIILLLKQISKKDNSIDLIERLGKFEVSINKEMNDNFTKLNDKIEYRLNMINDKVNERLDENFERTNKTFTNVLERLSKIDEAQKKIENLSTDIVSLQGILTDKKTRGIYGEVNLKHIMESVFGVNDNIYRLQYTLPNQTIADCTLFAPEPLGTIVIDSKFPLENYRKMVDKNIDKANRLIYEKMFKQDVKKHIDAISSKYIIPGTTSEQAIMFLPAEAIFAEINAYHSDLIDYSYLKKVWIVSPTTLISTLTVIEMIIRNIERDKYTEIIHNELNKLGKEFERYKERWEKLRRSIDTVNKDIESVYITSDKISKKFEQINKVDVKELEGVNNEKEN